MPQEAQPFSEQERPIMRSPCFPLEGRAKLCSLLPSRLEPLKRYHSCLAMPPFHNQDTQAPTASSTLPSKPTTGLLRTVNCLTSFTFKCKLHG